MGPSAHRLSLISALSRLLTALPHQTIDGLLCPLMQDPHFGRHNFCGVLIAPQYHVFSFETLYGLC